jgi:hypothetical protein
MSIDSKAAIAKAFYDMGLQFLEASVAAWPEDPLLPVAIVAYKGLSQNDALELFVQHFGPLIDRLSKREEAALLEAGAHPQVAAINVESKYKNANASTRETVWTYIVHLCRFASMSKLYKHIPTQILGAVNEAAMTLKQQIDAGQMDASAVNPFELGQQVMSKFDPQQLESMMREMMGSPDAVNSMLQSMSSLVAGSGTSLEAISAAATMFSGQGGPPGLDALLGNSSGSGPTGPNGIPNFDLGSLMKFMGPK